MTLTNIFNPLMILLLRSPLHILASKNTLLITFTGLKSGKSYTTPVNYALDGDIIYIVSQRDRTWWRNLRGSAEVSLHLLDRNLAATGEVIEDHENVVKQLTDYLKKVPQYARYFKVRFDPEGQPNPEDVAQASRDRIMISLRFNKPAAKT